MTKHLTIRAGRCLFLILTLSLGLASSGIGFSQSLNHEVQCLYEIDTGTVSTAAAPPTKYAPFGGEFTPKGRLHVLVVLLKYDSTNATLNVGWWPQDSIQPSQSSIFSLSDSILFYNHPANCGSFIANEGNGNLSDYFHAFSNPNTPFVVTGEVFPEVIEVPYGSSVTASSRVAFEQMTQRRPLFPWHKFDLRTRSNSSNFFTVDNTNAGPDGIIDYVVFIHRRPHGPGVAGWISDSYTYLSPLDNVTYKMATGHSVLTAQNDFYNFLNTFTHEFAHVLRRAPHQCGANGTHGKFFHTSTFYGMMDGGGTGFITPNAWERWQRGWMAHDLLVTPDSVPPSGRLYILKDHATQSAAMRILIPNSQHGVLQNEHDYLWLENHQLLNPFDKKIKWITPDSDTLSPGVYAYIADGALMDLNDPPSNENQLTMILSSNGLYPISGHGKWDWYRNGDSVVNYFSLWWPNPTYFPSIEASPQPNPIAGTTYRQWVKYDDDQNGYIRHGIYYGSTGQWSEHSENTAGPINNIPVNHFRHTAHHQEIFQPYQEFSLSGVMPILNYPEYYDLLGKTPHPSSQKEVSEPYFLNGLRISHQGFDGAGNAKIFVRYDDYEIRNSVRWAGEIVLPDLDTNSNQEYMKLAPGKILTLNLSGTPNRESAHPVTGTFVNPSRLTLESGSHLRLGTNATLVVEEFSTLRLKAGSRLELQAGARLVVRDGARLELEDGAWLDVSYTGHVHIQGTGTMRVQGQPLIDLEGPGGLLEIDGQLEIADSSTMAIAPGTYGTGEVHWGVPTAGPEIVCGVNSAIMISGVNKTDPILRVKDHCAFKPSVSLGKLVIEKGKVAMGTAAWISSADAGVRLKDLHVHALNPGQRWKTIYLNGQTDHIIQYNEISGAETGITGRQFYNQGAILHLQDCEISDCVTGVHVYSQGAQFEDCGLENNTTGLRHDLPTRPSRLQSCRMNNNLNFGADIQAATAPYRFESCENNLNGTDGIRFSGSANLILNCGSANHNGSTGVNAGLDARVFLDDSYKRGGARMTIVGNQVSLLLNNARDIYLWQGHNDIMSAPWFNTRRDVYGTLNWVTATNWAKLAERNHWNNRTTPCLGESPVLGTDYILLSANNNFIYLDDQSRLCPPTACSDGLPGDGQTETFRIAGNPPKGILLQTQHFNKVSVKDAVQDALGDMEEFEGPDDLAALDKLGEILSYPIAQPTAEETHYLDLAMAQMLSCQQNAFLSGKIPGDRLSNTPVQPYVQTVVNSQTAWHNAQSEVHMQHLSDLSLALGYHKVGRNDLALPKLNTITGTDPAYGMGPDIQEMLNYCICQVKAQNKVLEGQIALEDFEVEVAACSGSQKTATDDLPRVEARIRAGAASGQAGPSMWVFPNPASERLTFEVRGTDTQPATIRMFNLQGALVREEMLSPGISTGAITLEGLPAGIYLLQHQTPGTLLTRIFEVRR